MASLRDMYEAYENCMVRITGRNRDGALKTGSAFHIGDGYLVTARHVVADLDIHEVVNQGTREPIEVLSNHVSRRNSRVDLAVLEGRPSFPLFQFEGTCSANGNTVKTPGFIPLGGHLDDWIGTEFVMSKVLVLGYPPVPQAMNPVLVAAGGYVAAVIDKCNVPHPNFLFLP